MNLNGFPKPSSKPIAEPRETAVANPRIVVQQQTTWNKQSNDVDVGANLRTGWRVGGGGIEKSEVSSHLQLTLCEEFDS